MKKSSENYFYKNAFSMLELVFVIVIIGILAATIIPQTKTNPLQEAAVQLASHIKYTQHLAMMDDRYDSSNIDSNGTVKWYKERWQLVFSNNENTDHQLGYTIFSDHKDDSTGEPNIDEIAKNPQNPNQLMSGGYTGTVKLKIGHSDFMGMKKLNIGKTYAVISVTFSDSCDGSNGSATRISFDHLGRPFEGKQSSMHSPYNIGVEQRLIQTTCTIKLSDSSDSVDINIEPETGYVSTDF